MTLGASGCGQCVGSVGVVTRWGQRVISGWWIYIYIFLNAVYPYKLYSSCVCAFSSLITTLCSVFVIVFVLLFKKIFHNYYNNYMTYYKIMTII